MRRPPALALVLAAAALALGPAAASAQAPSVRSDATVPVPAAQFLGSPGPGRVLAIGADGRVVERDPDGRWTDLGPIEAFPGAPEGQTSTYGGFGSGPPRAAVTAAGGFAVAVRAGDANAGTQVDTVLVRDPGAAPRLLDPPADLLAGRQLVSFNAIAIGAVPVDGATTVFVAPIGSDPSTAQVLRHDADGWAAEPIEVPAGVDELDPVALDATGPGDAWLLASGPGGRALVFRREDDADPSWLPVALSGSRLGDEASPELTLAPKRYPADPLTATDAGAWIDVTVTRDGQPPADAAFLVDRDGATVTSFCDVTTGGGGRLCANPLGVRLGGAAAGGFEGQDDGYESLAVPGPGPASRIVTNSGDGSFARFAGTDVDRALGRGGTVNVSGAFWSTTEGYLGGRPPRRVGEALPAPPLAPASLPARRPLLAATRDPGGAGAVAVGVAGTVLRYGAETGWLPEPLRDPGTGARATDTLRAVAWPEPDYAIAVGDAGAVWSWTAARGTWEPDEGAPDALRANLTGVAFDAADPDRGYLVGREGTLLRYDKSFQPEPLPAGYERADLLGIAFAGRDALAVARRVTGFEGGVVNGADSALLVNDGTGWRVDEQLAELLEQRPDTTITTVAGLPDGGAVVAGAGFVAYRDAPGQPWRRDELPPPGAPSLLQGVEAQRSGVVPVAAAAVREDGVVRAVLSLAPADGPWGFPSTISGEQPDSTSPDVPTPARNPFVVSRTGYLVRATAAGWRDEQGQAFGQTLNAPSDPEPVLGLGALGPDGTGWVVGGVEPGGVFGRQFAETAYAARYPQPADDDAATTEREEIPLPAGPARLLVAGGAECRPPSCATERDVGVNADVMLDAAGRQARQLFGRPNGPRALLYTGGRTGPGPIFDTGQFAERGANGDALLTTRAELDRYAEAMRTFDPVPTFVAPTAGDLLPPDGLAGFVDAFAGAAAPQGSGPAPAGITPVESAAASGARTHYAFDTAGSGGTVRVVVIDLSAASLEGGDGWQNPAESQETWLVRTLDDARAAGIPAVVMGNAPLTPGIPAGTDVRTNPQAVTGSARLQQLAGLLVEHGASAYFFETQRQNRVFQVPAGAAETIPSFGTGSLNYGDQERFAANNGVRHDNAGLLLAEIDVAGRDPRTNRAPVSVRLIPVIEDLAIDPLDGTSVRRGRTALFTALARRPRAGNFQDTQDPYLPIPSPARCPGSIGCDSRVVPEYRFTSADPDIAGFVARDPASANPRAIRLGADGKPVPSDTSGLLCGFNPGRTTVTVRTGGLAYSLPVTVGGGSPQRPCGTVPLSPNRFTAPAPVVVRTPATAPASAPAPAGAPPGGSNPPPTTQPAIQAPPPPPLAVAPPVVVPPVTPPPATQPPPARVPGESPPPLPQAVAPPPQQPPATPPPPRPNIARPIPPSGTTPVQVSVFSQVPAAKQEREEEAAPEDVQAFSRYQPDSPAPIVPLALGLIVVAAAAGAGLRRGDPGLRPIPVHSDPE